MQETTERGASFTPDGAAQADALAEAASVMNLIREPNDAVSGRPRVAHPGPEATAGRKPVRRKIANAKSFGWALYAAGFAIWLFGYMSAGHAPVLDWKVTPWWISSFVPNLEAELGFALMFASAIPTLPWARLFPFAALLVVAAVIFAWWGFLAWLIWHWI